MIGPNGAETALTVTGFVLALVLMMGVGWLWDLYRKEKYSPRFLTWMMRCMGLLNVMVGVDVMLLPGSANGVINMLVGLLFMVGSGRLVRHTQRLGRDDDGEAPR